MPLLAVAPSAGDRCPDKPSRLKELVVLGVGLDERMFKVVREVIGVMGDEMNSFSG